MENPTRQESEDIAWRILNAKADCSLRLIEKIADYLLKHDVPIPTMQIMARSTVSGKNNDPAAAHALAHYTHDFAEAMKVQQRAFADMLKDHREDQRKPSKEAGD